MAGCCRVLAVMLLGMLPVGAAEAPPVWEVRGKGFDRDPRLPALEHVLKEAARSALARVAVDLGLRPRALAIRWVLDAEPVPEGECKPEDSFENGRTEFFGKAVVVTLPARKYLRRPQCARSVVDHEAAHAVLASAMGSRDVYERVPRWFREGLALDFASEGEAACRERVAYAVFQGKDEDSFLVGLEDPAASYAEAWMAVSLLKHRTGDAGLRFFLGALADGKELGALFEDFWGATVESFCAAAIRDARQRVASICPAETARAFRGALASYSRGEARSAAQVWESLLSPTMGEGRGALNGTLHYLLAKHFMQSIPQPASVKMAREHLDAVIEESENLWRPEALVLLGEVLSIQGENESAHEKWAEVIEVFGEDSGPRLRAQRNLKGHQVVK